MKFRNKILFAISGVVLSLLIATFFIVTTWTERRIRDTFEDELRSNFSTVRVLSGLQAEVLIRGCRVIAESPRLRAVTELRDPETATQLSAEITQTTLNDLFILTDSGGRQLARILHGRPAGSGAAMAELSRAGHPGTAASDVWSVARALYRVGTAPLLVNNELIGTLTIGFRLSDADIHTLRNATNSEILLVDDTAVVMTTLSPAATRAIGAELLRGGWPRRFRSADTSASIFSFTAAGEQYLATGLRLNTPTPSHPDAIAYILVKPIDAEIHRAMQPVLGMFALLSVLFFVITFFLGNVISRGITRPINALVAGTRAISAGEYDHAIAIAGKDELSFLGLKFVEMSRSLKEKISELDRLNRDLTERNRALDDALRKLREAQEEIVRNERLAATGKLTAQLAHEINNPIHNIQSCLGTALDRLPADAKGRELIELAHEEVGRMSKLTRQMLDFYRTAVVRQETRPVAVNDALREVIQSSADDLERAGTRVELRLADGLPEVAGDRDKLKQVFLNLVINARDAMPDGGELVVDTAAVSSSVRIRFTDSGIGIPKEDLGKIFDAFFTTKKSVSGVGLGLSVSYGIIRQHEGSIFVTSETGRGTTFTILLPAARDGATVPAADLSHPNAETS